MLRPNQPNSTAGMADVLQQLRDIHLPSRIHAWPIAPGYLILLILILSLLALSAWWVHRRYQRGAIKREALSILNSLQSQEQTAETSQASSMAVSALLRRVALQYYPRQQVASLQGKDWLLFLNETSDGLDFTTVETELLQLPFKRPTANDMQPLFLLAKRWIEQREEACLN